MAPEQELEQLDPTAVLLDDLVRRVAMANLEASQWRARALVAEAALEEMREAAVDATE